MHPGSLAGSGLSSPRLSDEVLNAPALWAKLAGHPFWPARFATRSEIDGLKGEEAHKPHHHEVCVLFFGDGSFGWVKPENLRPFNCPEMHQFLKKKGQPEANWLAGVKEAQAVVANFLPPSAFLLREQQPHLPTAPEATSKRSATVDPKQLPRAALAAAANGGASHREQPAEEEGSDIGECNVCGGDQEAGDIVVCDGCNGDYHFECCTPALDEPPDPDEPFYCLSCLTDRGENVSSRLAEERVKKDASRVSGLKSFGWRSGVAARPLQLRTSSLPPPLPLPSRYGASTANGGGSAAAPAATLAGKRTSSTAEREPAARGGKQRRTGSRGGARQSSGGRGSAAAAREREAKEAREAEAREKEAREGFATAAEMQASFHTAHMVQQLTLQQQHIAEVTRGAILPWRSNPSIRPSFKSAHTIDEEAEPDLPNCGVCGDSVQGAVDGGDGAGVAGGGIFCSDKSCKRLYHRYCVAHVLYVDGSDPRGWLCPRHHCALCADEAESKKRAAKLESAQSSKSPAANGKAAAGAAAAPGVGAASGAAVALETTQAPAAAAAAAPSSAAAAAATGTATSPMDVDADAPQAAPSATVSSGTSPGQHTATPVVLLGALPPPLPPPLPSASASYPSGLPPPIPFPPPNTSGTPSEWLLPKASSAPRTGFPSSPFSPHHDFAGASEPAASMAAAAAAVIAAAAEAAAAAGPPGGSRQNATAGGESAAADGAKKSDAMWNCSQCCVAYCARHLPPSLVTADRQVKQPRPHLCRECRAPSPRAKLAVILEKAWSDIANHHLSLPFMRPFLPGLNPEIGPTPLSGFLLPPTHVGVGHDLLGLVERVRSLRYQQAHSFLLDIDSLVTRCTHLCAAYLRLHAPHGQPLADRLNVIVESIHTLSDKAKHYLGQDKEELTGIELEIARTSQDEHYASVSRGETHAAWRAECMPPGYNVFPQPPTAAVFLTASRTGLEWAQYLSVPPLMERSTGRVLLSGSVNVNGVTIQPPPRRNRAAEDAKVATALRQHFVKRNPAAVAAAAAASKASTDPAAAAAAAAAALPPEWAELESAVVALQEMPRMRRFVCPRPANDGGTSLDALIELAEKHQKHMRDMFRENAILRKALVDYREERRRWEAGGAPPGDGVVVLGDGDVVTELTASNKSLRAHRALAEAEAARLRKENEELKVKMAKMGAAGAESAEASQPKATAEIDGIKNGARGAEEAKGAP